jgi:opacity protein-like surface antigen
MKTWLKELLTKILSNGFLTLLIVAIFYILYLRECKRPDPCPPKGNVLITQGTWDSIQALANKPAKRDTVYIKGDVIYVPTTPENPPPQPQPDPVDTTLNNYSDTLFKKDIDVIYNFQVKGTLNSRSWSYRPIITRITDSIPYPVIIKEPYPVKTPVRGLFLYGSTGGNSTAFLFGAGLDFITKKNTELGYQYQRFGNQNFHSVKLGIKLFSK